MTRLKLTRQFSVNSAGPLGREPTSHRIGSTRPAVTRPKLRKGFTKSAWFPVLLKTVTPSPTMKMNLHGSGEPWIMGLNPGNMLSDD